MNIRERQERAIRKEDLICEILEISTDYTEEVLKELELEEIERIHEKSAKEIAQIIFEQKFDDRLYDMSEYEIENNYLIFRCIDRYENEYDEIISRELKRILRKEGYVLKEVDVFKYTYQKEKGNSK